jgi:hypothetical protein
MDLARLIIRIMGSALDFMNAVRIQNMSDMNRVTNSRTDREEQVKYIEESFGVKMPSYYQFNRENPSPEQPRGALRRIVSMAASIFMIGALLGGAVLGISYLADPNWFNALAPDMSKIAIQSTGFLGAVSVGLGLIGGLTQDDQPGIDRRQTERYRNFLDNAEQKLQLAQEQGILPQREKPQQATEYAYHPAHQGNRTPMHFRDVVRLSQQPELANSSALKL